jgi:hypothetical protein
LLPVGRVPRFQVVAFKLYFLVSGVQRFSIRTPLVCKLGARLLGELEVPFLLFPIIFVHWFRHCCFVLQFSMQGASLFTF